MRFLEEQDFETETLRSASMSLELTMGLIIEQIQKKSDKPVPEEFLTKFRETLRNHSESTLRAKMSSIKQQAATIYAQEFTRGELIRLRQLSLDPVMVKARERNKVINPQLMALGANTMRESEHELEAKIQRLVAEYLTDREKGDGRS